MTTNSNTNSMEDLKERLGLTVEEVDACKQVTTEKQWEVYKKEIMKIEQKSHISVDVILSKGKLIANVEIQGIKRSSITEFDEALCRDTFTLRCKNSSIKRKNFTFEYVTVVTGSSSEKALAAITKENIYVMHTGGRVLVFTKEGSKHRCLNDNSIADDIKSLAKNNGATLLIYYPLLVGASGEKTGSCIFKLLRNDSSKDHLFKMYDKETCGAMTLHLENINKLKKDNKPMNEVMMTVLKANGRFAAKQTPCKSFGTMKGMALYQGEFLNMTPEYALGKEGMLHMKKAQVALSLGNKEIYKQEMEALKEIEEVRGMIDAATQDGAGYGNCMEIAISIFEEFGGLVDPDLLIGELFQVRPITCKISLQVLSEKLFYKMVDGAEELASSRGTEVKPYGDKNRMMILTDTNGLKMSFKEELFSDNKFEVLAIAKVSDGNTSKQILRIAGYAKQKDGESDEFNKLLEECMVEDYGRRLGQVFKPTVKNPKISPDEFENALGNGYINNLALKLNPELTSQSRPFVNTRNKQELSAMISDADRCRVEVNIHNRRMVADAIFILTGGKINQILGIDDCFINNPTIKDVIFFKYPIQGLEEYFCFTNCKLNRIRNIAIKKCKEVGLAPSMVNYIVEFFSSVSDKVIILPAFSFIAKVCAGSDFDFDGAAVMYRVKNVVTKYDELSNYIFDSLKKNFRHSGVVLGDYKELDRTNKTNKGGK